MIPYLYMELIIEQFTSVDLDAIVRLSLALVLGAIVGFERETAGKAAGVRTYGLVALGASLFSYISIVGFPAPAPPDGVTSIGIADPARIAAQVVVGIGFLGAGLIIFREDRVHGLTTAAGLWVVAGIGMSTGAGLHGLAIVATILGVVAFRFMHIFDIDKSNKGNEA